MSRKNSPGDANASPGLCRLVPEIEKVLRAYLQHIAELEHDVERNADVAKLDGADMAPVNIDKLRKLKLRELFSFPVINDVQTEFFVQLFCIPLSCVSPQMNDDGCDTLHKPCVDSVMLPIQVILRCYSLFGNKFLRSTDGRLTSIRCNERGRRLWLWLTSSSMRVTTAPLCGSINDKAY